MLVELVLNLLLNCLNLNLLVELVGEEREKTQLLRFFCWLACPWPHEVLLTSKFNKQQAIQHSTSKFSKKQVQAQKQVQQERFNKPQQAQQEQVQQGQQATSSTGNKFNKQVQVQAVQHKVQRKFNKQVQQERFNKK